MILLGDAAVVLKDFQDGCIDLTVTSPPYDNLRTYGGYSFDFQSIATELYRVSKSGGVVVWIVGDITNNFTESGTSFRQALFFTQLGFNMETMIYEKIGFTKPYNTSQRTYPQSFEYMFCFFKGRPKTFNPINDRRVKNHGLTHHKRYLRRDDKVIKTEEKHSYGFYSPRSNIWIYPVGFHKSDADELTTQHPAISPLPLVEDHIKSWSNEGDLILDPFAGSGTTLKAAHLLRRKWIGIEINPDYVSLIKKRLTPYVNQQRLTSFPIQ